MLVECPNCDSSDTVRVYIDATWTDSKNIRLCHNCDNYYAATRNKKRLTIHRRRFELLGKQMRDGESK